MHFQGITGEVTGAFLSASGLPLQQETEGQALLSPSCLFSWQQYFGS